MSDAHCNYCVRPRPCPIGECLRKQWGKLPAQEPSKTNGIEVVLLANNYVQSRSLAKAGTLVVSMTTPWVARNGVKIKCDPLTRRFFIALAARSPAIISNDEMIDLLWGDDAEGGPDCAPATIKNVAQRARHIAAALGVVVQTVNWRGYYLRAVNADALRQTDALAQLEETAA